MLAIVLSLSLLGIGAPVLAVEAVPPTEADTLITRAEQHLRRGEHAPGIALLEQAVGLAPGSYRARLRLAGGHLLARHYRQSIDEFQAAVSMLPPNDPQRSKGFAGLGIAYLHTGRYGAARAALQEAARLDPSKRPDLDPVLAFLDRRSRQ